MDEVLWRCDKEDRVWYVESWDEAIAMYALIVVALGWRLLYIHEPRCGGGWSLSHRHGNNTGMTDRNI
jgi:hypothetical protein